MKKIKLTLNKETIAKLEDEKMDAVKGGDKITLSTCSCVTCNNSCNSCTICATMLPTCNIACNPKKQMVNCGLLKIKSYNVY